MSSIKKIKYIKKVYVILISLQLILISGLRDVSVGSDTVNYKSTFYSAQNMSYFKFLNLSDRDYGYYSFHWLFSNIFNNFQVYLILIAILSMSSIGFFIYKNSDHILMSFLIFESLFFNFFLTGIRQTLAISILLVSWEFIKKRKFAPFLFIVLLSATFHQSALIFLPFYFIAYKKISNKYIGIFIILLHMAFIFKNQILHFLQEVGGYAEYQEYAGAGTYNFTLMMILIFIVAIILRNVALKRNSHMTLYYNALFISLLLIPVTYINPSLMRIVMYFNIFITILIPGIIESFKSKDRVLVYVVSITVLFGLYVTTLTEYKFFWQ